MSVSKAILVITSPDHDIDLLENFLETLRPIAEFQGIGDVHILISEEEEHVPEKIPVHCLLCVGDPQIVCARNPDVKCLICNQYFCGGHIAQHLEDAHCVALDFSWCSEEWRVWGVKTTPEALCPICQSGASFLQGSNDQFYNYSQYRCTKCGTRYTTKERDAGSQTDPPEPLRFQIDSRVQAIERPVTEKVTLQDLVNSFWGNPKVQIDVSLAVPNPKRLRTYV